MSGWRGEGGGAQTTRSHARSGIISKLRVHARAKHPPAPTSLGPKLRMISECKEELYMQRGVIVNASPRARIATICLVAVTTEVYAHAHMLMARVGLR